MTDPSTCGFKLYPKRESWNGGEEEGRDRGGNHPRKVFPSHNPKIMVGVGEGWGRGVWERGVEEVLGRGMWGRGGRGP